MDLLWFLATGRVDVADRGPGHGHGDQHGHEVERITGADVPGFLGLGNGRELAVVVLLVSFDEVARRPPLQPRPRGQPDQVRSAQVLVVEAHRPVREVVRIDGYDVGDAFQRAQEDRIEEPLLVTEVGLELRLVGAGRRHDAFDPCPGDAVLSKFLRGGFQNALIRRGATRGLRLLRHEPTVSNRPVGLHRWFSAHTLTDRTVCLRRERRADDDGMASDRSAVA